MTDLIRSACLTSYPEIARSLGLDPLRMLDACGIDRRCLEDPDIKLPAGALGRLLEVSAKAAKVEDFGLRLAETRTLSVLGPVGLLVREEATVRDALQALMRYIRLHNEALSLRLEERGGEAVVSVGIRVTDLAPVRQGVELAVGVLFRVLRSLLGPQWRPLVCFAHAAPRRGDLHRRVFGGRVAFLQDFNGIVCAARDLDRAIPSSDPALARYARQHLEALLARPSASMGDKVRELVWLQLASGRCTADHIAGQLGIDRRTLHRRLSAEGLTFSGIVDEVRTEIVSRTLPSRERSLASLADMLGFSCLSAFSRWFRGRFRTSPSAWRTAAVAPTHPA
ncbi:AraC-type DNA-binding protein [Enhydrobacter aerosaccus]|uniref:AraC-type DNA-binding protein n=1 Tax=Enhydrobacter aerosaccus TaxID=225324 RepID=A0A1T4TED4_9HYPH|nr:AraC family transcriptional regulator [Enhydrobacter aerosaccus]SKA38783.1 AraC-type DNA-binding protein [Enhydrobacter aerosaccus]